MQTIGPYTRSFSIAVFILFIIYLFQTIIHITQKTIILFLDVCKCSSLCIFIIIPAFQFAFKGHKDLIPLCNSLLSGIPEALKPRITHGMTVIARLADALLPAIHTAIKLDKANSPEESNSASQPAS